MLRALFVTAIIVFGTWKSLKSPFYALLFYLWIAYFRPEQWVWYDFVSQLKLSFLVGIVVLASTLFSGRRLQLGTGPALMLLFLAQSTLSLLTSSVFGIIYGPWEDFAKTVIISTLIVTLVDTRDKLRLTILVIALSLGLEQAKQGWAQLVLDPGGRNDNEHPAIGDNNAMAVAMFMLVPMLLALGQTAFKKYEKPLHRFLALGVVFRGVATYSRGGFLAFGALGLHYLIRSRHKLVALMAILAVGLTVLAVMPQSYWDRMSTIPTNEGEIESSDYSTRSRVHFWYVAVEMANANPLWGVGHGAYNYVYNDYDYLQGSFGRNRSVHSAWFGVLAELGYSGIIVFILLVGYSFRVCRRARKLAKQHPELKDLQAYANAVEAALVTFGVGASFVIFQYTELLWHTLALAMVIDRLVKQEAAALASAAPVVMSPVPQIPVRVGVAAATSPAGRF